MEPGDTLAYTSEESVGLETEGQTRTISLWEGQTTSLL